jgi:PAS domain S-box-containing protein
MPKRPSRAEAEAARFRALIEKSFDAVVLLSEAGAISYASPAVARIMGWGFEECIGRSLADWVHPDDQERRAATVREIRRHPGVSSTCECRMRHSDGTWRWIEAALTNLLGDPEVQAVVVNFRDVSDRKRAEAERDHLIAQLRLQIERMPLAYLLFDSQFRIVDWNPRAEHIFGYRKEEVLGMGPPLHKIVPAAQWPHVEVILARIRAGDMGAHAANVNVTKDGRLITCEWYNTPLMDAGGAFLGLLSLGQDVTARRESEEALRLHDRAIRAVTQGILITDPTLPDNPIVYASPGFERLTGYSAAEVLGKNSRFLQGRDTDPEAVARIREALREGLPWTAELLNYKKDGTSFWNELSISPVRDPEGRLTHFVGVQTDVSERRHLEEQYLQMQKMEAIGRLAGGVAHDFNNLLTVISGCSELLLQKLTPLDPSRGLIEQIHRAGERSAALTRQLLAFSRRQVVAPKVLDLSEVVADAEKMLRRVIGEDVRLVAVRRPLSGRVRIDPGQMEQVLLNLAVNARDAMPQGGRLTITMSDVEVDEHQARLNPDLRPGPYVLLTVADTGVGMSTEVQARIFEPFFTTKQGQGTGLGLSVVHGIVKQAGGHIEVLSEPGAGTTFNVYLPRVAQRSEPGALVARTHSPRGTETILVVEDDVAVRALSRHVLQGCGYNVLAAATAEEALRIATQHPSPIHLLATDVVLPGLGGRLLAERLLELHPETRVLYVSGYTDDAVVRHGIQQAKVHFLQKPFGPAALASKVREVLDRDRRG